MKSNVVDVNRFKPAPKQVVDKSTGSVQPNDPFEAAVLGAADLVPANELPWEQGQNGGRNYKTTRTQQMSGGIVTLDGPDGEPIQCRRQITFNVNYFPMGGTGSKALKTLARTEKGLTAAEKQAIATKWLRETGALDGVEESEQQAS